MKVVKKPDEIPDDDIEEIEEIVEEEVSTRLKSIQEAIAELKDAIIKPTNKTVEDDGEGIEGATELDIMTEKPGDVIDEKPVTRKKRTIRRKRFS
jgi:hypothetical protein